MVQCLSCKIQPQFCKYFHTCNKKIIVEYKYNSTSRTNCLSNMLRILEQMFDDSSHTIFYPILLSTSSKHLVIHPSGLLQNGLLIATNHILQL